MSNMLTHNKVYAFDADSLVDLWSPNPAILGSWLPLPDPNIGSPSGYGDITDALGILSTPVISLQYNAIYVVAFLRRMTTVMPQSRAPPSQSSHVIFQRMSPVDVRRWLHR